MEKLKPVNETSRVISIDLIRGIAVLAILLMNIVSFSNIGMGYMNPKLGAGIDDYNGVIHGFNYLFADMRFISIFSILFGVGMMIFSDNIIRKGKKAGLFHYRRMIFLLIIGLIHAYLIWMGDILVIYALCGSIVFLMRKWSNKRLIIIGSILFIIPYLLSLLTYYGTPKEMLSQIFAFWTPTEGDIVNEISGYRGSFSEQMAIRVPAAISLQTYVFLMEQSWRVLSMMMLGIVLYRTGFISAKKSTATYTNIFITTFISGLLISGSGLYQSYAHNWEGVWQMNIGKYYNYFASVLMAISYIAVIAIWSKNNGLRWLQRSLIAAGRMAFTNYILTSVICGFIFYGHGFGLFGTFDRLEQLAVVIGVWIVLLTISPLILNRFKQGPLEWVWRKVTYL
jgi:uncharacterized protein